jgi:hypothetical protein
MALQPGYAFLCRIDLNLAGQGGQRLGFKVRRGEIRVGAEGELFDGSGGA